MTDPIADHLAESLAGRATGIVEMIAYSTKRLDGPVAAAIADCVDEFADLPDPEDEEAVQAVAARMAAAIRALPADHVALVERWIAAHDDEGPSAGLRDPGQSELEHVLANISAPCVQFDLLSMDEAATHLPGIHAIILDHSIDDAARAAAVAALPDGATWLDWAVNQGPHPEDGRFFARWDGEKRHDLVERDTWRMLSSSKWLRWTEAMAMLLNAFPDLVEDYAAAQAHGRTLAHGEPNPLHDAAWTRMEAVTAEWRAENLVFFDPFKPFAPQIAATEPLLVAA